MLYSKLIILFLATVQAAPLPQASSSASCVSSYDGEFGMKTTKGGTTSGTAGQASDGQPTSGGATSQIGDGQTQSGAASQIPDGQPQSADASTQIQDGQIQSAGASTQIQDGQIQSAGASTQIQDGQIQSGPASNQIPDGQVQQSGSAQMADGQATSSGSGSGGGSTACKADDSLTLTLKDGILKDGKGRTGYIASNFQFQFDEPVQSGSLKSSGFSICDGKIALDGNTEWWACRSGDFYNLYSENWAPQCEPVDFSVVKFQGSC